MNLTGVVQQLKKERDRAEAEVKRLDAALAALRSLDGTRRLRAGGRKARRQLSAAARRKISLAQKARWRKQRQGLQVVSKPTREPRARVHWTQLPKNRTRVLEMAKKMTKARMAA